MSPVLSSWTGFGFLFIGIRLIGLHVQPLIGGRIHEFIARSMSRVVLPRAAGFVSGSLTSSASAVVFVSAGLISAGAASLAQTLPLLAWANVGTACLVLLASLDLRALALALVGGIGLFFLMGADSRTAARHALFALLGVALLMLGLSMVKEGALALRVEPLAREFFTFAGADPAVGYLVGLILSIVLQSSSVVSVMTLPLLQAGLLDFEAVVPIIYGACLGSGLSVVLLAGSSPGPAQQLALCQAGLRLVASGVMLGLWLIEHLLELPLVVQAVARLTDLQPLRAGLLFLLFQCVLLASGAVTRKGLVRLASILSPLPVVNEASHPMHLFDEGMQDPQTALELSRLETRRLMVSLPEFLDAIRDRDPGSGDGLPLAERHLANQSLSNHIDRFITGALALNPDPQATEALFRQRTQLSALRQLNTSLTEFTCCISAVPDAERPELARVMVEGLHAILSTAADALVDTDETALMLLDGLTQERNELMDTVRHTLLEGEGSASQRESLLNATLAFERALWQLRGLAREVKASRGGE